MAENMTSLDILPGGQFRTFADNVRVRLSEPAPYHYPLNPLSHRDNPLPHYARDDGPRNLADNEGDCGQGYVPGYVRDYGASYDDGDSGRNGPSKPERNGWSNGWTNGAGNSESNR